MPFEFTGDDNLSGFALKLSNVLWNNEVSFRYPYKLYHAETANSGFSFGAIQWDIAAHRPLRGYGLQSAKQIFDDILQNARDSQNQLIFNDAELTAIAALETTRGDSTALDAYRSKIDQALESTYGRQQIDANHVATINAYVDYVNNKVIASVTNADDRAFLQGSDLAKVCIADVRNQFGDVVNDRLKRFLQGESVFLTASVRKDGRLGIDDLLQFYFRTPHARRLPHDPVRRFSNIVAETGYTPADADGARGIFRASTFFIIPNRARIESSNSAALTQFKQLVLDAAKPGLFSSLIAENPSLAGLSAANYDSLDILIDPAYPSQDFDHAATLNARRVIGGVETAANNILIGEGGNDTLIGGKGDDVLLGGLGIDEYRWNTGDGLDTIVDEDKQGRIFLNGQFVRELLKDGTTYITPEGRITGVRNSPLTLSVDGEAALVIQDFADTDQGILRVREMLATEPTTRTIVGDLEPIDFDPNTVGVQTQTDDLGNLVTDPNVPAPNRADTLNGSAGADLIQPGGGSDTVTAGGGGDQVQAGSGRDFVYGEAGNDILAGGADGDVLSGGEGDDRLYASTKGSNTLTDITAAIAAGSGLGTGLQGDWLAGGAGDDILVAGADNDVLTGGAGLDLLVGGAGADNLLGDSSYLATSLTWNFTDSGGVRLFSPVVGEANPLDGAADNIYGGSGDDFIRGGRGDDVIYGEGDQDDIAGESGADVIFGGEGNDDLSGDASYIAGAEHGADYIDGGAGNDQIAGEGGEDVIFGSAGADAILGDAVALDAAFHGADFIDGGDDDDVIIAGGGDDILIGGQGGDVLVGDTGNDQLEGGIGADIMNGGEGDDRYVADASDTIEDGIGANTIALAEGDGPESWLLRETVVGNQPQTVLVLAGLLPEAGGPPGLTIHGRFEGFGFEFANGEVLSSGELIYRVATEGRQVSGTTADEILIGTRFDDRLQGFGGNDTLDGREGNDQLLGGEGDDGYVFDPGFGLDRIEEQIGSGFDTVRFGPDISAADVSVARRADGNLVLSLSSQDQVTIVGQYRDGSKIEQIEFGDGVTLTFADLDALPLLPITGTDGADTLVGTDFPDTLLGLAGDDTLDGKGGDDPIEGGAGIDSYAFAYGMGRDTFLDADGRIVLQTGLGLDGLRAFRQGDDLALLIRGTTEGAILKDYYLSPQSWTIEDTSGAQTTAQAVADATTAREQDWLNAQRDEYRYGLKARLIGNYVFPGSGYEFVGDSLLQRPWQASPGAQQVSAFGSWSTTDITTTIVSANGTVTVLSPFHDEQTSWSIFPPIFLSELNTRVISEVQVSDDAEIFSNAFRTEEQIVEPVVATVAWDRSTLDQQAEYSTITTGGFLGDGGYFISTARHSSFSGGVLGSVTAFSPFDSGAVSSGLFPERVEAVFIADNVTERFTEILAGPGDNTIFGSGNDVIDAGDGNDAVQSGGFVYGGTGDDVIDGADIAIGGPGNDTISGNTAYGGPGNDTIQANELHGGAGDDYLEGAFGASRFVFDVEDLGRDTVTDSRGLSVQELAGWYYPSIGIPDWQERLFDPEEDGNMSIGEAIARGLLPPLPQIAAHDWGALAPLYAAGVIEADAVEFAQGLTPGDVSLSWGEVGSTSPVSGALEAYTTLDASWGVGNMARIVIPHADDPLGTGVEEFRFADGSVLSMQELVAAAPPAPSFDPQHQDNALVGSARGEVILGRGGNDTLEGGRGGDSLEGGEGNDVYVFAQGDGVDYVFDEGGADVVRFAGDIAPEDVLVTSDLGGALILTLATGDSVTLANWFNETNRIESVEFADGTIWDTANLESRITVTPATEFDDIIAGAPANDVIDGLGGHDQISGLGGDDVLEGSAGDDLLSGGAGSDILRGGDGADGLSDGQGNNIFDGGAGDDGISAYGTPLYADGGSNFIIGGTGNDSIYSAGTDNVIAFNTGDGQDTVYPLYSLTLSLGAGIEPSALSLSQDGADLVLAIGASDSIRLTRQFEVNPQAWPQITLQLFGSVHLYDFNAVIAEFDAARAADPSLVQFSLDGVLQAHETSVSETDAVGGALAYQYGTAGNLNAVSDAAIRQVLADPNFGIAPQSIEIPGGNQAPVVNVPLEDQTAQEDSDFTFTLPAGTFVDADAGDTLALSAALAEGSPLPGWLSFDSATQSFSGTPINDDVSSFGVRVTATDGGGLFASDDFTLTVVNTNDAPTLANAMSDQNATEDAAFSFSVPTNTFADVDAGDTLAYSAALADGSALPAWLSFNTVTRTFNGTPANADVGTVGVKVTASDGASASVSDVFDLMVANTNDTPVAVAEGVAVNEDATTANLVPLLLANDTDVDAGDTRHIAAINTTGTVGTVAFDAATQTLTYSADAAAQDALAAGAAATDQFSYTVADAAGATAPATVTLTVTGVNDAPVLATPIADQNATENQAFGFQVPGASFSDIDVGDALAYSATRADGSALPSWLVFNSASRTFTGTPGSADIGTFPIRVAATDPSGAQAADEFNLSVALLAGGVTLTGTPAADNLTGTAGADTISGLGSADVLTGLAGNDSLFGGDGNDTLYGNEGADTLNGEANADALWGGTGNDALYGGEGNDVLNANEGEDLLYGEGQADTLAGGSGRDYLSGGPGNDQLSGEDDHDVLQGGANADNLLGQAGNDLLDAGVGDDSVDGDGGNDFLAGGDGVDTIRPGAGQDVIAFNRGHDVDTLIATGGPEDTVSIGGGIAYQDLTLSKNNNDLVLDTGLGDKLILKDWYAATPVHSVLNLQLIAEAMAGFDPASTDPLLNRKVQSFDFQGLVGAFDQARAANPALTSWALTNALLDFHLSGSDTEALGGDLAYQYGKNGALTGISLNAAQDILGSAQFGLQPQALRPLASLQEGLVKLS